MAGGAPQLLQLRHRRRRGVGRRAAVRRRDRRLGRALRAVTDELTPQGRFAEIAREDGRGALRHDPRGSWRRARRCWSSPTGRRRGSLGSPELDDEAARHADELMWSERSEQRGNALHRRHLPGAAADHLRRHRLRRPAVHAGAHQRLAALRRRPARVLRAARTASPTPRRSSPRGRRRPSSASAASTARRRSPCSRTTPSSTTRRSASRCAPTPPTSGAMGSRRAQEKRRERLRRPGDHRRGARAAERADRPRPRRADARGDRAVDHGRDRGPPPRPRGRPAVAPARRPHPRGHRLIGGVVLAAGGASRFGSPKQLAELDGRPLLQHAVDAMLAVPAIDPVVVVLGAEAERVRAAVDFGAARERSCARDWAEGMAASLRCGVDAVRRLRLGDRHARRPAARDAAGHRGRHGPRRVGAGRHGGRARRPTTACRATPWRSGVRSCPTWRRCAATWVPASCSATPP